MSKAIIICEGSTDLALIQYFLETTESWKFKSDMKITSFEYVKVFTRSNDELTIASTGGCTNIIKCIDKIMNFNTVATIKEIYEKIMIISDRDEINTVEHFEKNLNEMLSKFINDASIELVNDKWLTIECKNIKKELFKIEFITLFIPFEEEGALETFLLNSIAANDPYDAEIIRKGNEFVEEVDYEKRYLKKRRYITKAKFDVYFSIRTALEQFRERRNILRNIPWEEYEKVQTSFSKLHDL